MTDVSAARPHASRPRPTPSMALPDDDDDDGDAEPDDDDDERIAPAYHPRWSSRAGFGSPQWWSGS